MPKPRRKRKKILPEDVGRDVYLVEQAAQPTSKAPPCFPGVVFMLVGIDTYRMLSQLDVPLSAHKVMNWLCAHMEYGNIASGWTQAEIARDVGMHRTRIPETLHLLEAHDLIMVRERGQAALNPYRWYRGTLEAHREACQRWDRWYAERNREREERMQAGLTIATG